MTAPATATPAAANGVEQNSPHVRSVGIAVLGVAGIAHQDERADPHDRSRYHARDDHRHPVDLDGPGDQSPGGHYDHCADDDPEEDGVDQRRIRGGSRVAFGAAGRRRTTPEPDGEKRDEDRTGVGEIVDAGGQNPQGVSLHTDERQHGDEHEVHDQHDHES
jgi:hypothetical protein